MDSDVAADQSQRPGQEERDAPAPLAHCVGFLAAQNEEHARDHERPSKETAGRGGRDEAGIDASPRGRCVFSQEGAGAAYSPEAEKPWIMRRISKPIALHIPIWA